MSMRYQQPISAGELGVWDLRFDRETVHYSAPWKERLGFPDPHAADSTHFWRCRVHPQDLDRMMGAMQAHASAARHTYEARFRLRSNGSGYRLMQSRGRIVERDAAGRPLRMVGTMIDLTGRPLTPRSGLPVLPRGSRLRPRTAAFALPFHELLGLAADDADTTAAVLAQQRERVLGQVQDLLQATLAQLVSRQPAAA
jgi:hypothetical protein